MGIGSSPTQPASQAGTAGVRAWALRAGYEIPVDGAIPEHAIAAYNETHPDHPY